MKKPAENPTTKTTIMQRASDSLDRYVPAYGQSYKSAKLDFQSAIRHLER